MSEETKKTSQDDVLKVLWEAMGEPRPSAPHAAGEEKPSLSAAAELEEVEEKRASEPPRPRRKRFTTFLLTAIVLLGALGGGFVYRDEVRQSPLVRTLGESRGWKALAPYKDRIGRALGLEVKEVKQKAPPGEPAGHAETASGETPAQEVEGRKILYYYDPMHPAYKSDKPGIAPDCGMKLVPMYAEEAEKMARMPPGTVMLGPEKRQLIGVRTEKVRVIPLERTIKTVGRLTYDETKLARVHTKVPGWIEKIYVDFEGQAVKKGDPLFSLYSQDLVATQEEYLIALKGYQRLSQSPFGEISRGSRSLLETTRRRLELWDITDSQIEELARTGKVRKTLTLYSPVNGIVLKREAYEQQMITPEASVYTIVDLSTIWVLADIYEYELPLVRVGQPATMTMPYFPGKSFRGKITYLYPYLQGETRTLKARIEFPNPDLTLRPDMYADVSIQSSLGRSTVVSAEAVLDSGERKIVFVDQGGGYFEPREVRLGVKLDRAYQVLEGLSPGEVVVSSGNFLLDSESRLSMAVGGVGHAHGGSQPAPAGAPEKAPGHEGH